MPGETAATLLVEVGAGAWPCAEIRTASTRTTRTSSDGGVCTGAADGKVVQLSAATMQLSVLQRINSAAPRESSASMISLDCSLVIAGIELGMRPRDGQSHSRLAAYYLKVPGDVSWNDAASPLFW